MSVLPLSDIRVLDLSRLIRGPFATSILGDLGADVISVEPPEGDELRKWSTIPGGPEGLSGEFVGINRNKRSICINLREEDGKNIVYELAEKADVLIENFRPGVADRLGVGYEKISSINPKIVYLSTSGFGLTGPYRDREASEMVVEGMAGIIGITGNPDGPPCRIGLNAGELFVSENIAIAVFAALELRDRTGKGVHLDVSLHDVFMAQLSYYAMQHFYDGWVPKRRGVLHTKGIFNQHVFKTKDGKYLAIQPSVSTFREFQDFCKIYGVDKEWAESILSRYPKLMSDRDTFEECREEIMSTIGASFKKKTSAEWLEILIKNRIPCGQVNTIAEVFSDPQVQFYDVVQEMERPPYGKVKVLANPIRATEKITELRIPPALLGEHTDEILRELGRNEEEITKLKAEGVVK